MKILIVDDNIENIDMMSILLKSQNYEVQYANNGLEALEKLHSDKYDIIISDILMPVMDGFQFCKECKKDKQLNNIYFIFYTATYVDNKDEEFALSLGAQKFIRKPMEPEAFLNVINEAIESPEFNKDNYPPLVEQDEKEVLKLYSERLVKKLEKKNQDLEKEIASRKKIEKELIKAKEKAEESDRLKSAFLANMSHEIRTPLNAIVGFSNLFDKNIDPEKRKKFNKLIQDSTITLLKLIDDILDLSKIEANQLIVNEESCNINLIVNEIYSSLKMILNTGEKNNINLMLKSPSNELIILSDPVRLKQIFNNLLSNAIKFTNDRGQIEFGYTLQYKDSPQNKIDTIQFYVKDTGIGIPENRINYIFERFNKIEESPTKLYKGAGIGLTITKNLVELLGGKIWVESEFGIGSTFYFTLPYKPAHKIPEDIKIEKRKTIDWKNKTILIAEDIEECFIYLNEILADTGVNIMRAKNGKEAIDYCKKNSNINIVLMDIKMPGMDGYETIKIIKKIRPDLPIIVQTAYAMSQDKLKAKEIGADDYITKPIDEFLLMKKIIDFVGS